MVSYKNMTDKEKEEYTKKCIEENEKRSKIIEKMINDRYHPFDKIGSGLSNTFFEPITFSENFYQ